MIKVQSVQNDFMLKRVLLMQKQADPSLPHHVERKWFIDPSSMQKFQSGAAPDDV